MSTSNLSYPRPDFERSGHWQSLDGKWEFAWGLARAEESAYLAPGSNFPEEIVVPFPWESSASGLEAAWLEQGWYRRAIEVPAAWDGLDVVLHFGGAHHTCRVFLDGKHLGGHAGAGPFECDLTPALSERKGLLVVAVEAPIDKQAIGHGKQRSIPTDDYDSCAFQPSSGIWQPVWLEARPATFLQSLRVDSAPTLDAFMVRAEVAGPARDGARLLLRARDSGEELEIACNGDGRAEARFDLCRPRKWSPEDPHLYFLEATVTSRDGRDEVTVPAGLRLVEVVGDEIHLNGRRLYIRGVLDQGYWPGSGLSAPNPEALQADLELARAAGYNLVRKHLKLEDPRWLHLADTMGMLVWEEPPSTSRYSATALAAFRQELEAMVARDANHPCIIIWGSFNEEWGLDWKVAEDPERQDIVRQTAALVRALDPSRPVVDNSGWSHVSADLVDWHYYEPDLATWAKNVNGLVHDEQAEIPVPLHPPALEMKPLAVNPSVIKGRPNLNSEYGAGLTSVERAWHLKWQTQEMRRHDRLSGYVYTELYDVEHELAGIYRWDRGRKDLANMEPSQVNADTVLVIDLIPAQPGIDVVATGPVRFEVRLSHHGHRTAHGRLLARWGPHLGRDAVGPAVYEGPSSSPITAEPFVLGAPVMVEAVLPPGWRSGRLHLWVESGGASIASTSLDIVRSRA